ncbi:hypothetical protein FS837_007296 [Tulasnella sp. UAMH 9824]|nr:hypothetical protein FS837_007296 [Tulasnella sp. UAMH 9824]
MGIVSNTDPRRIGVSTMLNNAFERIQSRLPHDATPDNVQVYLNIPDPSLLGSDGAVEYYLIDYNSKSIFWAENVDILTDLAGSGSIVEPFESMPHLRLDLEPEFWAHVEFHPCHQPTYDFKAERELSSVLRHGCVDDMTAPGSVFPYSADECLKFLKLLERFQGDDESNDSYRRSWIARLWSSICRSRRMNRYGLPHPRVDRLQGLESYLRQQSRGSAVLALGEALCLGMSKTTFVQLTELWNGRIVYQRHWQPFLDRQRSKWRWTACGALYLLSMNAVQCVCGTTFIYLLASASFTCSTLFVSAFMLRVHSLERLKTASDIDETSFALAPSRISNTLLMAVSSNLPQTTHEFVPKVRLRPTLPSCGGDRYSGPLGSQTPVHSERVIPALSFVKDPPRVGTELESQWTTFTHPEGNKYYWQQRLKIVSLSNPNQADYDRIFRHARNIVEDLARAQNTDIQDAEAFFSVAGMDGNTIELHYYMIDHDKRVPFWLHPANVDQELPGIGPYESKDHLYLALRTEYWIHLESYPAHRMVPESAVDELTALLIHNGTDDVTSQGSISPWSADECLRYLTLFGEFKGKGPSSYQTAVIARVWSTVSRVRYMNRHGLPGPRLDRLQGIDLFIAGQLKYNLVLSIAEYLCFNIPKGMFFRLSELWNGRLVYIRHWDRFLDDYRGLCLRMASASAGIICVTTFLLSSKSLNNGMVAAISLGSIALFTSLYLHERHSNTKLGTAMDVSAYLSKSESFQYGLRPLSVLLSLPQALTIWAGLFFQVGLVLLINPLEGSEWETKTLSAWVAPLVMASLVFLFAGGGNI